MCTFGRHGVVLVRTQGVTGLYVCRYGSRQSAQCIGIARRARDAVVYGRVMPIEIEVFEGCSGLDGRVLSSQDKRAEVCSRLCCFGGVVRGKQA